ncbi:hypothetical protein D3C75_423270 [compost metagenome]
MSYDLMAFETSKAPQERAAFMEWYEQQVQWSEDHAYNDPSVLSEALQRFYSELSEQFPNMNVEDEIFEAMEEAGTDNRLTDYSLGSSVAEEAYTAMRELAIKHKVGFFDVSSNEGDIIFP